MKNISITLILVLVVGCGKTEDSLETIPTIELNKNELILAKGKTERLVATFTKAIFGVQAHLTLHR